ELFKFQSKLDIKLLLNPLKLLSKPKNFTSTMKIKYLQFRHSYHLDPFLAFLLLLQNDNKVKY
ncbi:MAG: hypothetical protein ACXAC7_22135, partial [Candidatus Hodarchaeales archaeon]